MTNTRQTSSASHDHMEKISPTVEEACENALDAFWEEICKAYPDSTTGDLSPQKTVRLREAACDAVREWVHNNDHGE